MLTCVHITAVYWAGFVSISSSVAYCCCMLLHAACCQAKAYRCVVLTPAAATSRHAKCAPRPVVLWPAGFCSVVALNILVCSFSMSYKMLCLVLV